MTNIPDQQPLPPAPWTDLNHQITTAINQLIINIEQQPSNQNWLVNDLTLARCLYVTLLHAASLEQRLTETVQVLSAVAHTVSKGEAITGDILQRLQDVEYATVSEAELERVQEDLAGGVMDRVADLIKKATGNESPA